MRIVLDTNVLISALAFPGSKPDQLLYRIRRGEAELFLSPFILSELDRVLRKKFRLNKREVDARVDAIRSIAQIMPFQLFRGFFLSPTTSRCRM